MVSPRWIIELGLEADRRAVGDDLHIMVGQARQQRAAGDVGDGAHVVVKPAFVADRGADIGDRRIVARRR